MIRIIALILFSLPVFAGQPSDKELAYYELMNYRINMIAINSEAADTMKSLLIELRLIRCKIEPIESDCFDIQQNYEASHGNNIQ